MSDYALNGGIFHARPPRHNLVRKPHAAGAIGFLLVMAGGLAYAAFSIAMDIDKVGEHGLATGALVLLGVALLVALGFEFVNGFHDTAKAAATVVRLHEIPGFAALGPFNCT